MEANHATRVKVIGVGGGGCNAVDRMIDMGLQGVDFIAVNTDAQALANCQAPTKMQIGEQLTRGLGAGADPEIGRLAAEESREEIQARLADTDMIFITAGLGGGTGTGGCPVIAECAKQTGALTIAVVTKPFTFEGSQRMRQAVTGHQELGIRLDTVLTIPNDRLLEVAERSTSLLDAFRLADDVLRKGVQGISDLITAPGLINLDFADVRAIMDNAGPALLGIGRARGRDRVRLAAQAAITSPLIEMPIEGATGILLNVSGGRELGLHEIAEAAALITAKAAADANIIFGAVLDESLEDEVRVTVVATGFGEHPSTSNGKDRSLVDEAAEVPAFLRRED